MKYLVNLDLNKNELKNAKIENLSTHPSNPASGQVYYNTQDKCFYWYNGSSWTKSDGHSHSNKSVLDGISSSKVSNWDIAYNHSTASHAPSNAQKNSDITKSEIEAKLTGTISTHNHDGSYTKPTGTIVANRVATFYDTTGKIIKDSGFTIASSVPANAKFTDTVYTHPSNHPATMITQDSNNRFVTDSEKSNWNSKAAGNHNHNGVYARKYATTIGDGSTTTIRVNHNLGTEDITILIKEVSTKQVVMVDVQIYDNNNIDIIFATAPAIGEYRVVVTG